MVARSSPLIPLVGLGLGLAWLLRPSPATATEPVLPAFPPPGAPPGEAPADDSAAGFSVGVEADSAAPDQDAAASSEVEDPAAAGFPVALPMAPDSAAPVPIAPMVSGSMHSLVKVPSLSSQQLLRDDAAAAYIRMLGVARGDGIAAPLLLVVSGLRDEALQRQLWEASDKSGKWVARPGSSSHETATALDLWLGVSMPGHASGAARVAVLDKMRATAAYRWLLINAERYGFYPYSVEPWHWEYGSAHDPTGATYRAAIAKGIAAGWLRA